MTPLPQYPVLNVSDSPPSGTLPGPYYDRPQLSTRSHVTDASGASFKSHDFNIPASFSDAHIRPDIEATEFTELIMRYFDFTSDQNSPETISRFPYSEPNDLKSFITFLVERHFDSSGSLDDDFLKNKLFNPNTYFEASLKEFMALSENDNLLCKAAIIDKILEWYEN